MSRRRDGWAPITFAAALLAGVLKFNGSAPDSTMHASSTRTPIHRQTGWLKGRVTRAITGLGLVGTIAVWGPQGWTDTQSVAARGVVLSSTAPATVQTLTRRPHLMVTKAGYDWLDVWPKINSSNLTNYATRYDVIYGDIPGDLIDRIRSINPNIILLQYSLPGATQKKSRYPDSYYVTDASGLKIQDYLSWYLLDFRNAAVRNERVKEVGDDAPAGADGYWLDVAGGEWLNNPYHYWKDGNRQVADLGDLDGGWLPSMNRYDKPKYTNGTWISRMRDFHRELKAATPGKLRIFNSGLPNRYIWGINPDWDSIYADYLANTDGAAREAYFVNNSAAAPEYVWRFEISKLRAAVDQRKYFHVISHPNDNVALRRFAFASYLLIADGKYAWFDVHKPRHYDSDLYNVDYGLPFGPYQAVNTANGWIYKRQFTKAIIWVNPGDVTRSGDGKTLGPKSAIIEVERPNGR